MKSIAVAACLLFATSLTHAQTAQTAQTTTTTQPTDPKAPDVKAPATKATTTKTPAGSTKATSAKKDDKKEEELPKIPGVTITRTNGNLLGLEVSGGVFKLSFYDKKHKLMAVDVTRATARWPNMKTALPAQFRTVLNGSGTALVGQNPVQPPYAFNVFLTLLQGEGEEAKAVETYTVPFKG
ncbi:MAG TPA: hypothetical protein VF388_09730 [Lacunisphaera sp.]